MPSSICAAIIIVRMPAYLSMRLPYLKFVTALLQSLSPVLVFLIRLRVAAFVSSASYVCTLVAHLFYSPLAWCLYVHDELQKQHKRNTATGKNATQATYGMVAERFSCMLH